MTCCSSRPPTSRADLLHALRFLKPVSSFRSQFAYDNLLYVVAGELVHAVTGQGWEDYVADQVLAPLGMRGCTSAADRLPNRDNVAAPHLVVEGHLRSIAPLEIPLVGPAGGIQCNVNGMARWLETQLAHGAMPDGQKHLFSAGQGEEMWSPQIPLRPQGKQAELTHTHFQAYGLGWGLEDSRRQAGLAQWRPARHGHA
ncbi:MAG: serine hydrolase domain-containing protein [Steroidobacteraceae bacterium]